MKNKKVEIISEVVVLLISLLGCILTFALSQDPWYSRFVMYTVLSNLFICFTYLLIVIFRIIKFDLNKKWFQIFKFMNVTCITLTFIVFALFLTPVMLVTGKGNPFGSSSFICHFVTPPIVLIQYFIFDRNYHLKNKELFTCLIIPLFYLVFIEIRGLIIVAEHVEKGGGMAKFPYFFLDPYYVGYLFEGGKSNINFGVIPFIIILIVIVILIGFIVHKVKTLLTKTKI